MTKDVKEDYVAKVTTIRSMTVQDLAREIARERTEYRTDTIVNIANLIDEKIRQSVCLGNTVVTGSALYSPSITGVFIGKDGVYDPDVNSCVVNISPSKEMREEVAKVKPQFTGYVLDLGGARIALVKDTTTGKTDGTITPGGIVEVTGTKIKCVNSDGSGLGKIAFVNVETGDEAATVDSLAINNPSRLMFIVPALEEGSYTLRIETYFTTATQLLTSVRVIEYNQLLTVKSDEDGEETAPTP